MTTSALSLMMMLCCVLTAACSPTMPSSASLRYDGQWSGTTAQGRPIAFTISSDQKVTAISIGYNFNSCSGIQTFSDLNLNISTSNVVCIPGQSCPATVAIHTFGYSTGNPTDGLFTLVNGVLASATTAQGSATFRNYPGCGTATGIDWTATRPR